VCQICVANVWKQVAFHLVYMCVSLGMFVSCTMMVEIGECNSHTRNFFQSLMQRTIHFHFEKTHFE